MNAKNCKKIIPPFDQHRELLARLTVDEAILRVIAEAGERKSWWKSERIWQRTYGVFDPFQAAVVTLLFESAEKPQEICRIEIFKEKPFVQNAAEICAHDEEIGWLRLARFPFDPELPALPKVLNGYRQATVLRYRPYKRCTIRFESADNDSGFFVKVFPDDRGNDLHKESLALWHAAQAGKLGFDVARPIKWEPVTRALWQGAVAGGPVIDKLRSPEGINLAWQIGRAAASLTRSNLAPEQVLDAAAQMERTRRYAKELRRRVPHLERDINLFLKELNKIHEAAPARALRPIHGSPHPQQWLEDGDRLGLVDFDRISLGAPELDAATFIAEMDFEDEAKYPVQQINAAFIAGYESLAGDLNRDLLRAYRAHKQFSKALKAARAVRPDGDARAERNLQSAMNCVLAQ